VLWLEATVGLLVWGGVTLLIDARSRRRRPSLEERLRPYQPSVADEAEGWLSRQQ
jgi:hypothetical protein